VSSCPKTQGLDAEENTGADEVNMAGDAGNMAAYPHRRPVRLLKNAPVIGIERVWPLAGEPRGTLARSQPIEHQLAATIMARRHLEVRRERGGAIRTTSYLRLGS
jgi:hypothetical protein